MYASCPSIDPLRHMEYPLVAFQATFGTAVNVSPQVAVQAKYSNAGSEQAFRPQAKCCLCHSTPVHHRTLPCAIVCFSTHRDFCRTAVPIK